MRKDEVLKIFPNIKKLKKNFGLESKNPLKVGLKKP